MRMKLRTIVLSLLALAIVLIMSCAPQAVSISDRINMFVSSLNSGGSSTYTNCDPNALDYGSSRTPSFWTNSLFPTAQDPYSASNINDSNSAAVTVTISPTGAPSGTYTFGMVNSPNMGSDNWLISTIYDPTATEIFK